MLPGFFVGAHAAVLEAPLLTLEVHHMWSDSNASITHGWVKRSVPIASRRGECTSASVRTLGANRC